MLQLACDAGLIGKPSGRAGIGRVLLLEHFDHHLPSQDAVGGAVNHAHAAAGNLLAQQVPRGTVGRPGGCAKPVRTVGDGKRLIGRRNGIARTPGVEGGSFRHRCPPRSCFPHASPF